MTKEEYLKELNKAFGDYTVYMHKNKINGKVYIGITYQKAKSRWRKNGEGYKHQKFYYAIQKYGWNNFEHIILFEKLTFEEACLKEQELIKLYNSNNRKYGYNHSIGGESGSKGSHWIMNEETKRKIGERNKGKNNGMYGKKPWNYGIPMSEKQKQLLSEINKGIEPWNKGQKLSDEHKEKVSVSTKIAMQRPEVKEKLHKKKKINDKHTWKKVVCIETKIIYESIHEAERKTKCRNSDIVAVCKGKRKTCGGYHWRYYEE